MRRFLMSLILLFVTLAVRAQSSNLYGTITDSATGEALFGANVYLPDPGFGTTTNAYGFYALPLADTLSPSLAIFSMLGYTSDTLRLKEVAMTEAGKALNVQLVPLAAALGTIEVSARNTDQRLQEVSGLVRLSLRQVEEMPTLLGEKDAMKALQLSPGVGNPREGFGGLYVRGGSPDQNLILLDGAPVYNAFHLFGFLSVFNTDALRSVDLYKGSFPARYGGRSASVIDVRMKEGNRKEWSGAGGIGLLTSRLTLEGPLGKSGKTSVLLSGRRSYLDLLLGLVTDNTEKRILNFHDFNFKINHQLSERDRLYLSAYTGRDNFGSELNLSGRLPVRDAFNWGNRTGTVRWNRRLGKTAFLNVTALGTDFDFTVENEEQVRDSVFALTYESRISNVGLQADVDWAVSSRHTLRMGAGILHHGFGLGAFDRRNTTADEPQNQRDLSADELHLYVEDAFTVGPKLRVNAGLRATTFRPDSGRVFSGLEPRLSLGYDLNNRTTLKAAAGFNRQYLHLLSNSGPGLPTSLWVPATAQTPAQSAWQYSLGVDHKPKDKNWHFSTGVYFSAFNQLIGYTNGATFLALDVLESPDRLNGFDILDNVTTGDGRAYGLEVATSYNGKKLRANLAYTYARVEHRLLGVNDFNYFPANQDRRHDLNLNAAWDFHPRLSLGFNWTYGSGVPTTLPTTVSTLPPLPGVGNTRRQIQHYEGRNGFRMPAVHRLDLSVRWRRSPRWGEAHWELGLYNAYGRANPFYLRIERQGSRNTIFQTALFPVLPSLSYNFKF